MTVFGTAYASVYDGLYADKDYEGECDLLEAAFARHGGSVRSIVDLGCGTGGHLLPLARRGYELTGLDVSPEMLLHARAKADEAGVTAELIEGDVRTAMLPPGHDAALLMFAVLSYMRTNDDVLAALRTARAGTRPGGLLLLDAWHGPAVLSERPEDRSKIVDGRVTRHAHTIVDARQHLARVAYRLDLPGGETVEEEHVVRFFFPLELELFLELAGFRLLSMTPAGELDGIVDEHVWNVFVVARAD